MEHFTSMKTRLGRIFCLAAVLIVAATVCAQTTQVVVIDSSAPTHPFPHFWEQMFGSGRAVLSLRDSYRRDLREVKQVTDFRYVRFHAVFHDEMGIYDEDAQGHPTYNFSYLDQSYDGLLANGVRPFVELSFMPKKLATNDAPHAFWYKPIPWLSFPRMCTATISPKTSSKRTNPSRGTRWFVGR